MSGGCLRCASYGSDEQRIKAAQRLAKIIDGANKWTRLPLSLQRALVGISRHEGEDVEFFANGIGLSPSTLKEYARKLRYKGLAMRHGYGKSLELWLTPAGWKELEKISPQTIAKMNEV